MNKKIAYIFATILCLTVITAIFVSKINDEKEYNNAQNIIDGLQKDTGSSMLYITDTECEACNLQKFQISEFIKNNNLQFYYIKADNYSNKMLNRIYKYIGIAENTQLPIVIIYSDGKLDTSLSGAVGTNRLFNMLNEFELVDSKLPINYLSITNYVDLLEKNKKLILGIGNYLDENSNEAEQVLWELSREYSININYMYTTEFTESETKLFKSKISNIDDYMLVTPGMYIIENGLIKGSLYYSTSKDEYFEFFKEYGIIS